ncbi:hypothetical protein AKJ16_DCAP27128 [Drosera capensis]
MSSGILGKTLTSSLTPSAASVARSRRQPPPRSSASGSCILGKTLTSSLTPSAASLRLTPPPPSDLYAVEGN